MFLNEYIQPEPVLSLWGDSEFMNRNCSSVFFLPYGSNVKLYDILYKFSYEYSYHNDISCHITIVKTALCHGK